MYKSRFTKATLDVVPLEGAPDMAGAPCGRHYLLSGAGVILIFAPFRGPFFLNVF